MPVTGRAAVTLSRADLEDMIAALCMVASIANCRGDYSGRDAAVEWAAEMAEDLASPAGNESIAVRDSSLRC
jgi:hypothetical protein